MLHPLKGDQLHHVFARRLQYFLAARNDEIDALRFAHWQNAKPYSAIAIAETAHSKSKATKTGVVRMTPVIPALAVDLNWWFCEGWEIVYGRKPQPSDYIIPSGRNGASGGKAVGNASHPLGRRTLTKWFNRAAEQRGIETDYGSSAGRLRNSMITDVQAYGANELHVSWISHPSRNRTNTTVTRYTKADWTGMCVAWEHCPMRPVPLQQFWEKDVLPLPSYEPSADVVESVDAGMFPAALALAQEREGEEEG
jgi:hypothetical protein